MSRVTKEIRDNAVIYYGNEECQKQSKLLLKEMGLPNGLLPLEDMEEFGYDKATGYVWVKQKKETYHEFETIGKTVYYARKVTAYIEPNKINKLTGVQTQVFVWITVTNIHLDNPPTGNINFMAPLGHESFPVSAFEIEEVKESNGVNNGGNEEKEL